MATVKKMMMMKKSAPSKAKSGTSLGMKSVKSGFDKNPGVTRADFVAMAKGKKGMKVKKAKLGTTTSETTKKPLSDKDSMNIYANRYDELSASGVKKLGSDKKGSAKDLKAADEARKNENRLAKKLYGTTPSNKKGGVTKKKMNMGGMMKKGGKMTKKCAYGCK